MKVLLAPTEDFIKRERSLIAADVVAGSNVPITLANSDSFLANDYVVVGWEGSELCEMCKITSVGGQAITVGTLLLNHKADEPVTKYRYNKRKFYGSLTSTGVYTELTGYGSPVQIQVDDPQGTFLEYTGGEGYLYFKSTYYNSTTTDESNIADADTVLADESQRYCSLYAIKKQAGLTQNPYINDGLVETYRRRAESEVDSYLNARYILPLINSTGTKEIPFLVENCTTLLAAGYMDYQEFGKDGQGVKWLGEARSILKKLQSQGGQQLLGSDKQEMQTQTVSNGVSGYPSSVDNTNGPTQKFTMDQVF
jgi:phage gp36-like protein